MQRKPIQQRQHKMFHPLAYGVCIFLKNLKQKRDLFASLLLVFLRAINFQGSGIVTALIVYGDG